jgi:hypothetical protein
MKPMTKQTTQQPNLTKLYNDIRDRRLRYTININLLQTTHQDQWALSNGAVGGEAAPEDTARVSPEDPALQNQALPAKETSKNTVSKC